MVWHLPFISCRVHMFHWVADNEETDGSVIGATCVWEIFNLLVSNLAIASYMYTYPIISYHILYIYISIAFCK